MQDPVQFVNDKTSVSLHQQMALGFAMPPIVPFKTFVRVPEIDKDGYVVEFSLEESVNKALKSKGPTAFQVPITLKFKGKEFKLPVDPIVSISSKNILIRRYVSKSKSRGSIKERWSKDDWTITISGLLTTDDDNDVKNYQEMLLPFLEAEGSVEIVCDVLNNIYNVTMLSIEDYDIPFTPGIENQQFSIKAYSDDMYNLLIES